jgi:hypothetical protein
MSDLESFHWSSTRPPAPKPAPEPLDAQADDYERVSWSYLPAGPHYEGWEARASERVHAAIRDRNGPMELARIFDCLVADVFGPIMRLASSAAAQDAGQAPAQVDVHDRLFRAGGFVPGSRKDVTIDAVQDFADDAVAEHREIRRRKSRIGLLLVLCLLLLKTAAAFPFVVPVVQRLGLSLSPIVSGIGLVVAFALAVVTLGLSVAWYGLFDALFGDREERALQDTGPSVSRGKQARLYRIFEPARQLNPVGQWLLFAAFTLFLVVSAWDWYVVNEYTFSQGAAPLPKHVAAAMAWSVILLLYGSGITLAHATFHGAQIPERLRAFRTHLQDSLANDARRLTRLAIDPSLVNRICTTRDVIAHHVVRVTVTILNPSVDLTDSRVVSAIIDQILVIYRDGESRYQQLCAGPGCRRGSGGSGWRRLLGSP